MSFFTEGQFVTRTDPEGIRQGGLYRIESLDNTSTFGNIIYNIFRVNPDTRRQIGILIKINGRTFKTLYFKTC